MHCFKSHASWLQSAQAKMASSPHNLPVSYSSFSYLCSADYWVDLTLDPLNVTMSWSEGGRFSPSMGPV